VAVFYVNNTKINVFETKDAVSQTKL